VRIFTEVQQQEATQVFTEVQQSPGEAIAQLAEQAALASYAAWVASLEDKS
jgi:hypothetical protein